MVGTHQFATERHRPVLIQTKGVCIPCKAQARTSWIDGTRNREDCSQQLLSLPSLILPRLDSFGAMATRWKMKSIDTAVVALAGRRIDLPDAQVTRFPLENIQEVGRRVCEALCKIRAVALVCSAACGADLVALEQARLLGLRRRIVLPFAPERFRQTSVIDRPGDWGPVYDQQVAATVAAGDLLVLEVATGGDAAYAAANEAIVREAQQLSRTLQPDQPHRLIAILVWEGAPRPGNDATARFRDLTRRAGFEEQSISTLSAMPQQTTGTDSSALM
jgi:hypothetical protein